MHIENAKDFVSQSVIIIWDRHNSEYLYTSGSKIKTESILNRSVLLFYVGYIMYIMLE